MWQSDVIPGLRVRTLRQERLISEPALQLSVVMDEACLLRGVGDRGVMRAQLAKLAEAAELPNVELRVLPLDENMALVSASFAILSFGSKGALEAQSLGDVVSTESLSTELYVEGEADTHLYRLFFQALSEAALSPAKSRDHIVTTMQRVWS